MSAIPPFAAEGEMCVCAPPIRCLFPEQGGCTIEVAFFQAAGRDVLKGEVPFTVALESE